MNYQETHCDCLCRQTNSTEEEKKKKKLITKAEICFKTD